MKLINIHNRRFFSRMRMALISVLTLIAMSHSSALSLEASKKERAENQVNKGAEKLSGVIKHRSVIGQPIIGRHSGGSINGFAGILYAIPQPPRVESVPITVGIEDSLYEYQIHASDANGDEILFTVMNGPAGLSVNENGLISWTPSQENVGINSVQIAVYDDRSDSTIHSWSIEVSNQNDPPTIALPDTLVIFDEDSSVTISFIPFISDSESVVADLLLSADSILIIEINNETKSVTISGLPDSSGLFRVEFTLTDPENLSSKDTTTIVISPVNDAPIVSGIPDITFLEDSTFTIDLDRFVTDVDNDSSEMTWSVKISVDTIEVIEESKAEETNAKPGIFESDSRLRMILNIEKNLKIVNIEKSSLKSDRFGNLREKSVFTQNTVSKQKKISEVSVRAVTFRSRNTSSAEAAIVQYSSEGDALDSLTVSIDSVSHVATFSTPANYFASNISVVFSATDPGGLSGSDSSTVNVSSVNDAPVLAGIPDIEFNEDDSLVIHFEDWFEFVNDEDNADSTLIWSIITSDSDSISVIVEGDSVLFNAPENWFAIDRDTITVTVRDSAIESSIRVAVHVLPVNDAPSLSSLPDTLTFGIDTTLVIDISDLEIDIDDPDSLLEWHAEFKNQGDSLLFFNILGDSIIEITSEFEGIGEDTLILTVTDTSGASDTTSIFVQVTLPVGVEDEFTALPEKFELFQNYPNPFNPTTTIRYALPVRSDVTLRIYNLMGQEVLRITHDEMRAGYHEERWHGLNQSGRNVASGIYIYRIQAGDFTETKKMLLLK